MNIEAIVAINTRYHERIHQMELSNNEDGGSHFRHITHNLIEGMKAAAFGLKSGTTWESIKSLYMNSLRELRTYLRLIEQYPEFRQAEFASEEGMFPDMPLPKKHYAAYAKARL